MLLAALLIASVGVATGPPPCWGHPPCPPLFSATKVDGDDMCCVVPLEGPVVPSGDQYHEAALWLPVDADGESWCGKEELLQDFRATLHDCGPYWHSLREHPDQPHAWLTLSAQAPPDGDFSFSSVEADPDFLGCLYRLGQMILDPSPLPSCKMRLLLPVGAPAQCDRRAPDYCGGPNVYTI